MPITQRAKSRATVLFYDPRYDLRIILLSNKWMPVTRISLPKTLLPAVYSALDLKE